jgi:hypothetical protein
MTGAGLLAGPALNTLPPFGALVTSSTAGLHALELFLRSCAWGLIPRSRVIYSCKVLVGRRTPYLGPDTMQRHRQTAGKTATALRQGRSTINFLG